MKLEAHIKMVLLLTERQELGDKFSSNTMHVQVFYKDNLADSINNSNHVEELMEYLAVVLLDEFINCSPYFLAFLW